MSWQVSSSTPESQHLNPFERATGFANPLHPFTEFDLVEHFAEKCGNDFAYVSARKQWFCRSTDKDGQPCWEADETSRIFYYIRLILHDLAAEAGGNPNLCTAATVRAVEELARADDNFARPEADLAPGELAKEAEQTAAFLEFLRRDKEADKPVEVAAPVQPTAATAASPQRKPPQRKPPKPKQVNPVPAVDNPQTTTTPRGLIDDMARWAAIGSAA